MLREFFVELGKFDYDTQLSKLESNRAPTLQSFAAGREGQQDYRTDVGEAGICPWHSNNDNFSIARTNMAVDIIFKIAGIGLLTAIINVVLKKSDKDEIANFVTIAGLILVLILVLDMLGGLFDTLKSLLNLY